MYSVDVIICFKRGNDINIIRNSTCLWPFKKENIFFGEAESLYYVALGFLEVTI